MNVFRKATLATVLAATALSSATPAMARDSWGHRNHRGGGDDAAIAVGAGIVGLAIGAILVSNSNKKRDRYDDRHYQGRRYDDRYYRDGWQYRDGAYYDRNGRRYNRDAWRRDYGDRYSDRNSDGYDNRYDNDDRRRGYDRGDDYERRGY